MNALAKITDFADVYAGGGAPQNADDFSENGIPFLRAGSLPKLLNGAKESDLEKITNEVAKKHKLQLHKKGSVVFAKSGMSATKGHIYRLKDDCYVVNHLAVIKPNANCDSNYLEHALKKYSPTTMILDAAYPSIRLSDISDFKIPLPPIAQQQRIAAILDKAAEIKAKREQAIVKLDVLAHCTFVEMFGNTLENNKNFPVTTLGEMIDFQGGSQPPASTFTYEEAQDTIRLVQIRDFRSDKYKTYIPKKLSKRFFDSDDVMIGRYGPPVFQIFRGLSGSYNVALMKAVPKLQLTKDFIFYLLQEKYLHKFVVANSERTAGQSGVNLELLEKYKAYLPPIHLQQKYTEIVKQIEKQKVNLVNASTRDLCLLASLQHQAFTTGFNA